MAEKSEKKKGGFVAGIKGFFGRIAKFFRDTVSEMKKVVWPGKKQIINNTLVVIAVVVVAALVIFILDSVFGAVLSLLLKTAA